MESTTPNNLFSQYTSMIKQFKLPGLDITAILESRRKDIEALLAANSTALSGMQALGQKQADILRAAMADAQSLIAQRTAADAKASGNAGEVVQQGLRKAVTNMQDLADTLYKTQADCFAVISKRVTENVEELKARLQPGK
ncbi:phasin family protein [Cupriavidus lacunae]|uniref:Phasin family protein n=1 Tax=Cupriavidus lacunae TaxID=2666307 RepID=A0A370NM19_9BURK|nr:phasin family protein [Cupriavidus lacunae]RDK06538.1 phasin family protein [Cupriavidus lacunae]